MQLRWWTFGSGSVIWIQAAMLAITIAKACSAAWVQSVSSQNRASRSTTPMCVAAHSPPVNSTTQCFCQPAVLLSVCQKARHSKNQSQYKRCKLQTERLPCWEHPCVLPFARSSHINVGVRIMALRLDSQCPVIPTSLPLTQAPSE